MGIHLIEKDHACRLIFDGCLTFEFARELEDCIIDALRRYTHFEVDLSGVLEIDLCGLHLLRVLETVGGENFQTVAGSLLVEQAQRRLLAPGRGVWLRGCPDQRSWDGRPAMAA